MLREKNQVLICKFRTTTDMFRSSKTRFGVCQLQDLSSTYTGLDNGNRPTTGAEVYTDLGNSLQPYQYFYCADYPHNTTIYWRHGVMALCGNHLTFVLA